MSILKILFLLIGIVYGFTCFGRLIKNQSVSSFQNVVMAIGIVGFISIQFNWI